MAKPRGLRTGPLPDPYQFRHLAPTPAGRTPPFLVVADGLDLVLIAPFRKRRRPTAEEVALVKAVAAHLRTVPPPCGSVWIDPHDGTATPATIAAPQIRRRLVDCPSFTVRPPPPS